MSNARQAAMPCWAICARWALEVANSAQSKQARPNCHSASASLVESWKRVRAVWNACSALRANTVYLEAEVEIEPSCAKAAPTGVSNVRKTARRAMESAILQGFWRRSVGSEPQKLSIANIMTQIILKCLDAI